MKKSKPVISKKSAVAKAPAFQTRQVEIRSREPETIGGDADLHARLAIALADGPVTYGELRRRFDISPVRLEWDCIQRFPEAYVKGADQRGAPTIGLKPNRPLLAVMLDREPIVKWIVESGEPGIYLASLHKHVGLTSARIEELLVDFEGVERLVRDGRIMYRAAPNAVMGPRNSVAPIDPAILRDELIALCADSKRHLSWLELHMERYEILTVLSEFPNDFGSMDEGLSNGDKLVWVSSSRAAKKPLAETRHNRLSDVRPEAKGPLLNEVFTPAQLKELKHRPHAPGMGTRRVRRPLVEI